MIKINNCNNSDKCDYDTINNCIYNNLIKIRPFGYHSIHE